MINMTIMHPDGVQTKTEALRVTIVPTEETKVQIESFRGPQGIPGPQGPRGEKGEDGSIKFDELTPEQMEVLRGPAGANGKDGSDGVSPSVAFERIEGGYRLMIVDAQGAHSAEIMDGADGPQGPAGPQGIQGPVGERGPQGEHGAPFAIAKVYASQDAMNAGYASDGVAIGGFALIETGDVDDEENARLYVKGESRYEYVTDLSGAQGIQGPQGIQGERGPTGAAGADGAPGKDGTSVTVKSVSESSADGGSNVVAFSDGKSLTVKNGKTGAQGPAGADGKDATVTSANIKSALGYTPASETAVSQLSEKIDGINVPKNVSELTNDAEYISNKPGFVTERLDSNLYGWKEGYYCNYATGKIVSGVAHYSVTDYLAISSDWKKIIAYVRANGDLAGVGFYNQAKEFISGIQISDTDGAMALFEYEIPSGAAYVCITTRTETIYSAYVDAVKQADGALDRIVALEAKMLSVGASGLTYGYAASNILCIGDSLTAGAYYAGEANGLDIADGTAIAQNYPYYLSRMMHCRTTNAGTNGYSASDWYNKYITKYVYADYDTFIIWLGTNYGCTAMPTDAEISAFTPSSSASASTANQALYLIKIIQTIQEANTSCHIVLCSVFGSKSDKAVNNEVVQQIANKYGCQFVDMSDLSYSNHPELHAGVNNPHFGKAGNIFVANRLTTAINDYLVANPSIADFGTTVNPMPILTANEKNEIVAAVIASLPVYNGEVV